jgi:SAM-dependent methyltransferase
MFLNTFLTSRRRSANAGVSASSWSQFQAISKNYLSILNQNASALPKDYENVKTLALLADYKKYIDRVLELDKPDVLDWGCGNGHVSFFLKHLNIANVTSFCVAPKTETKQFLEDKLDLRVVTSSCPRKLPFPDNSFDIVLSSGVLEHVNEYGGSLEFSLNEISRVLRPGGRFLVWRLPFAFSIWEYAKYCCSKWSHEERFTMRQLERWNDKHRLKIVKCELDGFLFVRLRAFMRGTYYGHELVKSIERFLNWRPMNFLLNDIFVIFENQKGQQTGESDLK